MIFLCGFCEDSVSSSMLTWYLYSMRLSICSLGHGIKNPLLETNLLQLDYISSYLVKLYG